MSIVPSFPLHDGRYPAVMYPNASIMVEDGTLEVDVYRKPTHTDCYLWFSLHHPVHVKCELIRCLYHRAEKIILSNTLLGNERKHLCRVINSNGYPSRYIKSSTANYPSRQEPNETPSAIIIICIPYISGVSENSRKLYKIKVIFKAGRTLRSSLTRVKDPLPVKKQSMLVYQIPRSFGQVYISKTISRQETRIKEHKDPCSQGQKDQQLQSKHGSTVIPSNGRRLLYYTMPNCIKSSFLKKRYALEPQRTTSTLMLALAYMTARYQP